jgi:hypothetical protein
MVRVVRGSRRYHGPGCPLIKGDGDCGIETMPDSEARAAGLTGCPVCLRDGDPGS